MTSELPRYKIGQEISVNEIRLAYSRITEGQPIPRIFDARKVAAYFSKSQPLRFEFEINRQRGFAWDNGECPICDQ